MIPQQLAGPALRRSSEPFVSRASSLAVQPRLRAQSQSSSLTSRRFSISQSRGAPSVGNPNDLWRRELSELEEDRRKRIDAMKKWLEEDPYSAFFGRSNSFLNGNGWSDVSFIPEWVRKELGLVEESSSQATTKSEAKTADVVKASSTSPLVYDPISQRMVAENSLNDINSAVVKSSSTTPETESVEEGLQSYDDRAKESETTPAPVEEWLVEENGTSSLPGTSAPETEAVTDALSAYDQQSKKETKVFKSPEPQSWLVQEGQGKTKFSAISEEQSHTHTSVESWATSFATPIEPVGMMSSFVADASSKVPQGLQTSFERELASGVRLEDQLMAMNQTSKAIMHDACSTVPQGLQTAYAREVAECKNGQRKTLEQELMEMAAAPKFTIHDACSQVPQGLQTSYAREVAECKAGLRKTLAQELAEMTLPTVSIHDACSRVPQGLQTSYAREVAECKQGRQTLEQEIMEKSVPVPGYSDICSREPIGLRMSVKPTASTNINGKAIPKEVLKQANIASAIIAGALVAQKKLAREVEGRVDGGLHGFLGAYEQSKGAMCYNFEKDSLEAELAAQNDKHSILDMLMQQSGVAQAKPVRV